MDMQDEPDPAVTQFRHGYARADKIVRTKPDNTSLATWVWLDGNRPHAGDTNEFRDGYLLRVEEAIPP